MKILNIFTFTIIPALVWTQSIEDKKVICYYTSWSVYRTNQFVFKPSQIDPFLCTHVIYAFGAFDKDDNLKPFDDYQDIVKEGYKEVTSLRSLNREVKTLLSLGGGREASKNFSPIAASEVRRGRFSRNLRLYLRRHGFDGVSVDWQYPALREGSRPEDKQNLPLLLKELYKEFSSEQISQNQTRLLISITVPAREEYIEKGYDIQSLQEFADLVNIAAYDYHYPYEPSIYHHSPLYPLPMEIETNINSNLNVEWTVNYLKEKGAELGKYTLGMAAYGRTFKLMDPNKTELGSPSKAQGSSATGIRAYYDVCSYVKDGKWTLKNPNSTAMGPYAFRGEDWVSFDDEEIVKKKGEFSAERGLGGLMFWSLDNDDFRGECGETSFPLIRAGRSGLEAGLARLRAATTTTTTAAPEPPQQEILAVDLAAPGAEAQQAKLIDAPALRGNISAIANKSAALAADILSLSNFSTTVLLDSSSGGERMARLDNVIFREEQTKADETIHTFQPQYGLELGGKLNQSHFYSIKIWVINNLFNF